ncbi:MAG: hypothetical protein OXD32_04555 [Endozoicomonadaceae bacterium]|nr:hypothetical protein [Endozoicomonadaceae bacterium]
MQTFINSPHYQSELVMTYIQYTIRKGAGKKVINTCTTIKNVRTQYMVYKKHNSKELDFKTHCHNRQDKV